MEGLPQGWKHLTQTWQAGGGGGAIQTTVSCVPNSRLQEFKNIKIT